MNKIIATIPRYKSTFLQSSSSSSSSSYRLSRVSRTFLLTDMKSQRIDTEMGFKGIISQISSSMCIKEQQHADVSCVWSSSEYWSPESGGTKKWGSITPSILVSCPSVIGYRLSFSEGQQKSKNKTQTGSTWRMFQVKGHHSFWPSRSVWLILAQLTRNKELTKKKTGKNNVASDFSSLQSLKAAAVYWYCL